MAGKPKRKKTCKVCASNKLKRINSAIFDGISDYRIGKDFKFDRTTIKSHREICLADALEKHQKRMEIIEETAKKATEEKELVEAGGKTAAGFYCREFGYRY